MGVACDGSLQTDTVSRYLNSDYSSFEQIVEHYRSTLGTCRFDGISVDVAGPVEPGKAKLTNVEWTVTNESLSAAADCQWALIMNDLSAMGHGLTALSAEDVTPVFGSREDDESGKQLVINVGTGFNTALVIPTNAGWVVSDSECGRVTLPVRTEDDNKLKADIELLNGYAGLEHVLSGRGVRHLHGWVKRHYFQAPPSSHLGDPLLDFSGTPEMQKTGSVLTRILATVAGDLALHHLPVGGIFLVGGVVRALSGHFTALDFERAFCDKGDYSNFMRRFSVSIISDDLLALKGCAAHAAQA